MPDQEILHVGPAATVSGVTSAIENLRTLAQFMQLLHLEELRVGSESEMCHIFF